MKVRYCGILLTQDFYPIEVYDVIYDGGYARITYDGPDSYEILTKTGTCPPSDEQLIEALERTEQID